MFMQIFADDQATFCLVSHFVSRVATVGMYYRKVERPNTTVWMFNRHRNFKVRNDFTIAKDFPRCKVLTSQSWFSDGLRNNYMRARISFRCLFAPSSLFASILPWTDWVGRGDAKTDFAPGRRNP